MTTPTLDRILAKVNDPAYRKSAYREIRQHFKGVKALCAATQSHLLITVGAIHAWEPNCGGLTKHLLRNKWTKAYRWDQLRPGCLCFMEDANKNGISDHVVTFIKWEDFDKRVATVYDNQSRDPHPRNLGKSLVWRGLRLAKLSFWYALLAPETLTS